MIGRSDLLANSRGRLYFLCGLPQSGKSHWANRWALEATLIEDLDYPAQEGLPPYYGSCPHLRILRPRVVLGGDDFRQGLTGKEFLPLAEAHVFAAMDTAARALLSRGFDVLIDETSSTEETILRYLRIDVNAVPVILNTPRLECERRALGNNRPYLLPVIDRIDAQLRLLLPNLDATLQRLREKVLSRSQTDTTF